MKGYYKVVATFNETDMRKPSFPIKVTNKIYNIILLVL